MPINDLKADELIVKFCSNHKWQLEQDFKIHLPFHPSLKEINIKKGFITDFASIPKLFWSILSPTGKYAIASLIHDYLYSQTTNLKRKECDRIFLKLMKIYGVSLIIRYLIYFFVRLFGKFYFYDK
jgi:hypothetical protein